MYQTSYCVYRKLLTRIFFEYFKQTSRKFPLKIGFAPSRKCRFKTAAYLESSQISTMEPFCRNSYSYIFAKKAPSYIFDWGFSIRLCKTHAFIYFLVTLKLVRPQVLLGIKFLFCVFSESYQDLSWNCLVNLSICLFLWQWRANKMTWQ